MNMECKYKQKVEKVEHPIKVSCKDILPNVFSYCAIQKLFTVNCTYKYNSNLNSAPLINLLPKKITLTFY